MTREQLFKYFEKEIEDYEIDDDPQSDDFGDEHYLHALNRIADNKERKERWRATLRYVQTITSSDRGVPKHSLYLLRKLQIKGWVRNVLRPKAFNVPTGGVDVSNSKDKSSGDYKSARINLYIHIRK